MSLSVVKARLNHPQNIKLFFWILGLLLALVQAVANRNAPSTLDIISYLDIADAYLRGDWAQAINGNWSPLYSWLLALALGILKPSPFWEFSSVKLVNFLIFVFSFASFEFFLNELLANNDTQEELIYSRHHKLIQVPLWIQMLLAYTLFLFAGFYWVGVDCDTPDMITVGLIYLATGLVLRISKAPERWINFVILGVVLAFGYFSKAVILPLAFVFLMVAFLAVRNFRKAVPRIIATFLVFSLITSPYISALSTKFEHLTFSETGKLCYVWFVYPTSAEIPFRNWQGENPFYGTPRHPTRKIFAKPDFFEFDGPVGGTYSPWTDPAYWNAGIIARFNLKAILVTFTKNILFYYKNFLGILVFSYLTLVIWSRRLGIIRKCLMQNWHLLTIAISGLGIYALSYDFVANDFPHQPVTRYIAAFIVLLFVGVFRKIPIPNTQSSQKLVIALSIVTLLCASLTLSYTAARNSAALLFERQNINWQVASGMKQLGLQAGDKIAIIDDAYVHVFWSRLARVRIITDQPTWIIAEKRQNDYKEWLEDKDTYTNVLRAIRRTGASVVVTTSDVTPPEAFPEMKWQQVNNTKYYAYFFLPKDKAQEGFDNRVANPHKDILSVAVD